MKQQAFDTLVLLPGLDGTGDLFDAFTSEVRNSDLGQGVDIRVVRYPRATTLERRELVALIAASVPPGSRTVLVAESFSGPLAVEYAATAPQGLCALVLVATFVSASFTWLARTAFRVSGRLPLPTPLFERLATSALTGGSREVAHEVAVAVATVAPRVIAARSRMLFEVDAKDALAAVRVPILAIAAEQDLLVSRVQAEEIARLGQNVCVRTVAGPHLILQTHAGPAATALRDFLRERLT